MEPRCLYIIINMNLTNCANYSKTSSELSRRVALSGTNVGIFLSFNHKEFGKKCGFNTKIVLLSVKPCS